MTDLASFLQRIELEKYHLTLCHAGLDTILKLSSASEGHLKFLGIPLGSRKKMKGLGAVGGEGPISSHGQEQMPTAGGTSQPSEQLRALYPIANVQSQMSLEQEHGRSKPAPLWSASSGARDQEGVTFQHLISLGKENATYRMDHTASLSLHQIFHREDQEVKAAIEQSLLPSRDKDQRSPRSDRDPGPGFVIVPRDEAKLKTTVQLAGRNQRQASDDVLCRLRGLRSELKAAEDLVKDLRQMVADAEQEASGGGVTREVIEIE